MAYEKLNRRKPSIPAANVVGYCKPVAKQQRDDYCHTQANLYAIGIFTASAKKRVFLLLSCTRSIGLRT
jgi:hypothetical protein